MAAKSKEDRPGYSITEVEDMTGITAHTIRYYDKCGFFPNLGRDSRGRRYFTDSDLQQLTLIEALRYSGLSIEGIGYFVRMQLRGRDGVKQLMRVLSEQKLSLDLKMREIEECQGALEAYASEIAQNAEISQV
ncbi:MerR family transcriptional regulator [Denitrobacterium detoxificans]|jgi:DNA-binding transcriptional MerR regulator|uniref:MerR family transcriptional regulator n=1 Tax=Denitrobacterium detoxificans TaxID=79604 RepID=UPI0026EF7073|nr:MerR family transcriptional regulator [Denitrobacterium detoxificans]MBE6466119.1 MerR family transcriptional regulator [Denitrobacterium detoxificans]